MAVFVSFVCVIMRAFHAEVISYSGSRFYEGIYGIEGKDAVAHATRVVVR